jgi:hypothetical protein
VTAAGAGKQRTRYCACVRVCIAGVAEDCKRETQKIVLFT